MIVWSATCSFLCSATVSWRTRSDWPKGETNILGGIISETETVSITGIPGLKDIPLLKYIFGQEHKTRDQAEVIIMLTPHIVRMPEITEEDLKGIVVGSETNLRMRPNYGSSPTPLPLPAQPRAPTRLRTSFRRFPRQRPRRQRLPLASLRR